MPISEKQQKILLFPYLNNYRALICDGAVRSGKTSIMTVAFVDWAMREFNNTNFAICGKTVGSAIKNIITPYMALSYSKKYNIRFTRSDNKMIVRRGDKINTFYVYGGKDESSYMLIQGITLAGVLLDEVALMTQSFVEEAIARCVTFANRKYWFNCNPDTPMHWFYKEWILQPEKHKALHLHFVMQDNPILTHEAIRETENDFSGVFYDRKVLGKWVVAQGLIYPMFNKEYHVALTEPRPYSEYQISIDYGTYNPFHALLWGLSNGVWYCVKELRHSGREGKQKDPQQYFDDLRDFIGELNISKIIIDPSADAFIATLRNKGEIVVKLADNDVLPGIEKVSMCLNSGLIKINDCCKHLIDEFGLYSWNEKSEKDEPIKENDHGLDSLRYFVYTNKLGQTRRKYLREIK